MPCLIWLPRTLPAPPESRLTWGLASRQFLLPELSSRLTKLDKYILRKENKIDLGPCLSALTEREEPGMGWRKWEKGRKHLGFPTGHAGANVYHKTGTVLLKILTRQESFIQEHQGCCLCLWLEPQTVFITHTVVSTYWSSQNYLTLFPTLIAEVMTLPMTSRRKFLWHRKMNSVRGDENLHERFSEHLTGGHWNDWWFSYLTWFFFSLEDFMFIWHQDLTVGFS